MNHRTFTRRELMKASAGAALAAVPGSGILNTLAGPLAEPKPVVSIARVKDGKIEAAVEEAIDLLGGIELVTQGKSRILLKPNLVSHGYRHGIAPRSGPCAGREQGWNTHGVP